jgi:Mrp family chromosome partitioning ATPase
MARAGKKVILVDANLRHPTLNDEFNTLEERGLVEVLLGSMSLNEALVASETANLSVLYSGRTEMDPSGLFSRPELSSLMQDLRDMADTVVLDAPSCYSADVLFLAAQADCILQVVGSGKIEEETLRDASTALQQATGKPMVYFMNRVPAGERQAYIYYSTGATAPQAGPSLSGQTLLPAPEKLTTNGNGSYRPATTTPLRPTIGTSAGLRGRKAFRKSHVRDRDTSQRDR